MLQLSGMNLSKVRELSLEKCNLNAESLEAMLEANLPSLRKLNLSKSLDTKIITE